MSVLQRHVTGALALAIITGATVAGCGASSAPTVAPPSPAPTSPEPVPSIAPATAPATATATSGAVATDAAAADGRVTCEPLGARTPGYTVALPDGWVKYNGECGFVILPGDPGVTAGLSAWAVGSVPRDPCRNHTTLAMPEPGVEGLVTALLGQEGRNQSTPEAVSLAGHDGIYLEWTVPDGVTFTDGMEFHAVGCDDQNFLSWNGRHGGTRYQQAVGQVDRLWVLDVDGEVIVVDASYAADASDEARDQLQAVVDSLEFIAP